MAQSRCDKGASRFTVLICADDVKTDHIKRLWRFCDEHQAGICRVCPVCLEISTNEPTNLKYVFFWYKHINKLLQPIYWGIFELLEAYHGIALRWALGACWTRLPMRRVCYRSFSECPRDAVLTHENLNQQRHILCEGDESLVNMILLMGLFQAVSLQLRAACGMRSTSKTRKSNKHAKTETGTQYKT